NPLGPGSPPVQQAHRPYALRLPQPTSRPLRLLADQGARLCQLAQGPTSQGDEAARAYCGVLLLSELPEFGQTAFDDMSQAAGRQREGVPTEDRDRASSVSPIRRGQPTT